MNNDFITHPNGVKIDRKHINDTVTTELAFKVNPNITKVIISPCLPLPLVSNIKY